jgi:hypothetical protein
MARTTSTKKLAPAPNSNDKLLACLNWHIGLARETDPNYQTAPSYFDAAWEWYRSLSLRQKDVVAAIVAAWTIPDRRKAAERWATALPAAPKCPL